MAAILRELVSIYDGMMEKADPRVAQWPLMGSPLPMISIVIAYNIFVYYLGPKLMENRQPLELKKTMILYNVIVIISNIYFLLQSIVKVWIGKRYHLYLQPVDYSSSPHAMLVVYMTYLYFFSKVLDLFDTVFIVLRKKSNQLSFLHTYHHSLMVIVIWTSAKYVAGGSLVIVATVNGFVHAVMYSYYLLTIVRPEYKKSVWWKRHLTELQMIQFVFLGVVFGLIAYHTDNVMVRWISIVCLPQDVFIFLMFLDFYRKTYLKKQDKAKTK